MTCTLMTRTLTALAASVLVLSVSVPASAQQDGGAAETPAKDAVVARVNGSEIRQSDVALAYSRLPEQYKQVPITVIFPQIVQQLVDGELLANAGRADDLQDSDAVKKQMAEFEKVAIQQEYMNRLISDGIKEEELRKVYDETIANQEGPLEVRASHILVDNDQEAADIIKALEGGADFAELARERSTGPSGPRGGDLGYNVRSALVEPFANAAFALEPGDVGPEPVQTEFGWHVIKVIDKRRQPAPSFEESRAQIEQRLTRDLIAAHMAALRADSEVELFNIDGSPIVDAPKQ
jgi:peptidyl-prolyl cis-trans isomerase C